MILEQLQDARAERWRQKNNPALTLDDAEAWVNAMGLCLFLPRRSQLLAPAPSLAEACLGAPSDTPSRADIENARGLMMRLTESGAALPLNLFGVHTEQPDFLSSRDAFPYIFSLRGGRNWKTPPPRATPLVVEIWKLLEPGASLEATEIQAALGREITEAAVLRGLFDLWSGLRVMPVYTHDGPTRWELTQSRFSDAMNAANKTAQTTGLSALVSLYLESVIAATPEEIETFLSPLTARSKVREVVNGLTATRQLAIVPVGTQTMLHVAGSLPEFAEAETPAAEPEKAETAKPAFPTRPQFREQRPPFERERREQLPRSGPPPRRDRFAAQGKDRAQLPRSSREGERRESRPFRKFDQGKRSESRRPAADAGSGDRRPFKPRRYEDRERSGGKFPPKKFGQERDRPRTDRGPGQYGPQRDRPAKKFGGNRPSFRGKRELSAPDQSSRHEPGKTSEFPPRRGGWKPSRFAKFGKQGEARREGSQDRRERPQNQGPKNQRDQSRSGGRPGGGKFTGKKFGGPQSRGRSAFKSGPKPGGSKPPFGKWKNKGKKDGGKNPE
ncbi:MAG: hypothetical protein JOZ83_00775 [Silvibacterium sp.]|nr:hypothetical protein [Silvibacterium sp.]